MFQKTLGASKPGTVHNAGSCFQIGVPYRSKGDISWAYVKEHPAPSKLKKVSINSSFLVKDGINFRFQRKRRVCHCMARGRYCQAQIHKKVCDCYGAPAQDEHSAVLISQLLGINLKLPIFFLLDSSPFGYRKHIGRCHGIFRTC